MCKLYQNISKLTPITHQSNVDLWQKRMTKNTTQKQLRFLMPQTSGHTQVSQSQSSSSAHVPGQSQTLSFTNPRCSNATSDKKMLQVATLHYTCICAQQLAKKKPAALSPQSAQEPSGKEHLPGGGHWKRGSCAAACAIVQLMASVPACAMAGVIPKDKRSKGPQKHRISRMYVFNNLANHVVYLKMFIGSTCSNDNYAEKGCQKNLSR